MLGSAQPTFKESSAIDDSEQTLRVYQEVCKTLSVIDDFRARLLGLLPLSSGVGIFLLLEADADKRYLGAIGLVGFLVSAGLFIYELSQSAICRQLIEAGKLLESEMGLAKGQFIDRRTWLSRARTPGEEESARPVKAGPFSTHRVLLRRTRASGLKVLARLGIRTWVNVASWVVYLTVLGAWAYLAFVGFTAGASNTVAG